MSRKVATISEKEMQIIAMFRQNMDAKEIAENLHFADHREMANYMRSRGYVWNSELKNYEIEIGSNRSNSTMDASKHTNISSNEAPSGELASEVISFLKAHKDILMEICSTHTPIPQVPRYVIPGVYTTKSVYMNHNFDLLARQFSQEKNVSQRDIFEIALIDFFKKYGYQEKVKALVSTATPIIKMVAVFAVCLML
jgi:hypothetical protein